MHRRCVPIRLLRWTAVAVVFFAVCRPSLASFLMGKPEKDSWSDMAFPTGISGGFDAGTQQMTLTASPSNDLEIGSEFGPSNAGRHYGFSGTLGGPFSATLSISGVVIQPGGAVTNGGSLVITFNGSAPGSLGDDYGIVPGNALLTGSVLEVLMDATGADTLDVLFGISGGALQTSNGSLGTNFSPSSLGLLRFKSQVPLPGDFSSSFTFASTTTLDVFGTIVPEFPYTTFVYFIAIFGLGAVLKSRFGPRFMACRD